MPPSRPRKAPKEPVTLSDRLLGRRRSPWASGGFGSPEETRSQVNKNGILAPRIRRFLTFGRSPEVPRGELVITTCWEPGTKCLACNEEFGYGEEMLHGRHLRCASDRARNRDAADEDVLILATARLSQPGRLTFTARQLRHLVLLAALQPVRKPDAGKRLPLYGRMPGWSAARVQAGLSAAEVAGLWLDFLDVGKIPPVRHADLSAILASIGPVASGA